MIQLSFVSTWLISNFNYSIGFSRHPCCSKYNKMFWWEQTPICIWWDIWTIYWASNKQLRIMRCKDSNCQNLQDWEQEKTYGKTNYKCYWIGLKSIWKLCYIIGLRALGQRDLLGFNPIILWQSLSIEHVKMFIECYR